MKQVSEKIQVPLVLKLMKQAGMKQVTIEFIRNAFSKGAEYVDDVDISGLSLGRFTCSATGRLRTLGRESCPFRGRRAPGQECPAP